MPALRSFSAADEEYDQLGWDSEAEEKEEDPEKMDEKDESGDEKDDVKRDEVEAEDVEALKEEEDSKERSQSSSGGDQSDSEYMEIDLADILKDVQCSICLGVIKQTRTVMECLHRFCRECIDKSMRLGKNECPTCRKHCASRRSLRDDPNFDAFIATLFKNIDIFEEEELAMTPDDEARNKQIQASIAQVSQRQSAALAKRSSEDAAVLLRPRRSCSGSRRKRNFRKMEQDTSEAHDDDDQNNRGKDSSSDEPCADILQRKRKKCSTAHPSSSAANNNDNCAGNGRDQAHPSSSAANSNENCAGNGTEKAHPSSLAANNNDNCAGNGTEQAHPSSSAANNNDNCTGNGTEKAHPSSLASDNNDNYAGNGIEQTHHRDSRAISLGLVWNLDLLAWGRGGTRSNSRQRKHGARSKRTARVNRLVEYLGSLEGDSFELDIHLKLISLDTKCLPNLLQPYLCCPPTLLVKQLCEYVARQMQQMQLKAEEVELLVFKEGDKEIGNKTSTEKMQSLKDDETLAKLKVDCISSHGYLIVVYRQKRLGASDQTVYMNGISMV